MTREETIQILKEMLSKHYSGFVSKYSTALNWAINALEQEKEPAPSANDTSSSKKNHNSTNNDTAKLQKCQEAIEFATDVMYGIYDNMSRDMCNAWELGQAYQQILDARKAIEEDKQ